MRPISKFTALLTCLLLSPLAAAAEDARPVGKHVVQIKGATCYEVSAKRGWQGVNTKGFEKISFLILGPEHREFQRKLGVTHVFEGWSVDGARYAKVGTHGHLGADAEALEPYAGFKYDRNFHFGALLMRARHKDAKAINLKARQGVSHLGSLKFERVSFRINDSDKSLADNSGETIICVGDGL